MPNDHLKKQPSKAEKMAYELYLQVQQLHRVFMDVNNRLIALCRAKIEPEVLAKFMLEEVPNESFMKNLNLCLDEEIKKKNEANKKNDDPSVAK